MIPNAFASQWVKLRRRSLLVSTYLGLMAVSALFTVLVFARAGRGGGDNFVSLQQLAQPNGLARGLNRAALLLGVVAFGLAAAQVAIEFTNGTLRQILVRQPRRPVLLAGMTLGILTFLLGAVLIAGIGGGIAALIMAHVRGVSTAAWTSSAGMADLLRALGNSALAVVGYGVLGILVGLALRAPAPAVVVGFVYLIPLEGLAGSVIKGSDHWLPGQLLATVSQGGSGGVAYSHALLVASIYVVIAILIAGTLFTRRDVTA